VVVISKRPGKGMRVRWFFASALAALWLFTGFAASSAELHHCLHEDAPASDHQCLLTKYTEGHFANAPTAEIARNLSPTISAPAQPSAAVELSGVLSLLPPGRAPPLL
jgi:hypothetical protein